MNEKIIMFDSASGEMFQSSYEKIKLAQEKVHERLQKENAICLGDLIENLEEETQYQLWKRGIELFGEELGAPWVIDGDIMYRSPLWEDLGIGIDLRDVFFNGKELELNAPFFFSKGDYAILN